MAAGDPLQGVDVAQAAGAAFYIGFKIIAGAVGSEIIIVLFIQKNQVIFGISLRSLLR